VIRLWNRGATRIFGFTEAEALGRSPDIVIPERLRERHWQGYRTTMRTGQTRYRDGQVLSIPAVRKDGAQISVGFTIVPFTNDAGQMIGIAAIMRDATARFEELRALRLAADPAANRDYPVVTALPPEQARGARHITKTPRYLRTCRSEQELGANRLGGPRESIPPPAESSRTI
jgi:PAS domain S-box-containing protein